MTLLARYLKDRWRNSPLEDSWLNEHPKVDRQTHISNGSSLDGLTRYETGCSIGIVVSDFENITSAHIRISSLVLDFFDFLPRLELRLNFSHIWLICTQKCLPQLKRSLNLAEARICTQLGRCATLQLTRASDTGAHGQRSVMRKYFPFGRGNFQIQNFPTLRLAIGDDNFFPTLHQKFSRSIWQYFPTLPIWKGVTSIASSPAHPIRQFFPRSYFFEN